MNVSDTTAKLASLLNQHSSPLVRGEDANWAHLIFPGLTW
jgi:hypothetical protein